MGIELDTTKIRAFGDKTQRIVTSPPAVGAVPTAALPTAWGTGWYHLGLMADAGVVDGFSNSEQKIYAMQGGALARTLRTQNEETFTFQCLERRASVLGLLHPAASITTTGGTSEVQTITITGTPTAGTFLVSFRGASATVAYNAAASAVQTALQGLATIGSGNATVTGGPGPGTPWVVTFAGELAKQDVPALVVDGTLLTGGTPAIAVTITTPGVNATNTWKTSPYTGQNLRQFGIDLVDGSNPPVRKYFPNAEAVREGDITYGPNGVAIVTFKLTAYPDANGDTAYTITTDPAYQSGIFA